MSATDETRRGGGRGGRNGHEPPSRIHARELRAMELSVQGWSQRRMAAELGISQPAVSKMLRRLEERVLRELAEDGDRQKARQTNRLEHLYTEALGGWEHSKADATRRRQRKTEVGTNGGGATIAELVVENRHGDPRFLDLGRKILADLRTLWGLDAPQKVDLRASHTPFADLSDEALEEQLDEQRRLLAAVASGEETTDTQPPDHGHGEDHHD